MSGLVRPTSRACSHDFWKVPDGGGDRLGFDYALAFLRYEAERDHNLEPYILPWIVSDMPAELTQIEIGFLTVIGSAAVSGLQEAERLVAYWRGETGELSPAS